MTRCPCNFCNASDDPPTCFDCNRDLTNQEPREDMKGNPICEECADKKRGQAEQYFERQLG
jgi:hypothetical protein